MGKNFFKKGMFCTLPIVAIKREGNCSFFIVSANDREYAIRMFSFQTDDPSILGMKELPCMVKDVHGDSIVFVQNFAMMFGDRYQEGHAYEFIVNAEAYTPEPDSRVYDIRDTYGVPFKIKCRKDISLMPTQRIKCRVYKPSLNKLELVIDSSEQHDTTFCISPEQLLCDAGIDSSASYYIMSSFHTNKGFDKARAYYEQRNPFWVIEAITAVSNVESWPRLTQEHKEHLLDCYRRLCMYLLEDTDYLLQFGDSEREDYQRWLSDKVAWADIYSQCMSLIEAGTYSQEIDTILHKIRHSGYIYQPHSRMQMMIALFSLKPELLEEKIDSILDIIGETANKWTQTSFGDAFASFLKFYIKSNGERANRLAAVDEEQSRTLLNRMVRSIGFMLLMTADDSTNCQLYKSMLLRYLSFVKPSSVLSSGDMQKSLSERLTERAFDALLLSDDGSHYLSWGQDFSNTEVFAYRMANTKPQGSTFLTRTYEAHNVRFTVGTDGITISRAYAARKERNVLPQGFPGWHDLQIFLDSPGKYSISKQTKNIKQWKSFWNNVEQALFEKPSIVTKKKPILFDVEVGTITYVRILWKDDDNPYRYYCKVEDQIYQGEGWIDTYQKGGSIGMFHYDPKLGTDSFYIDGKPMLLKVRVNSIVDKSAEKPLCIFDCMSFIDNSIRDMVSYDDETECQIMFIDTKNDVFLGITKDGYGIFIPKDDDNQGYTVGDYVYVKVTDTTRPNSIQGEIIGQAEPGTEMNIKAAATGLLQVYWEDCGGKLYEETEEEQEEEAMSMAEDVLDASYVSEIVNILDHKAVLATDNITAYAFLALAHLLSRMSDDSAMMQYLEQRQHFLCIIEDYATNDSVANEELENLGSKNEDIVEHYPLLRQRLTELRIVNCLGHPEKNAFLWDVTNRYAQDNILSKLSRLMLSYNAVEGFGMHDFQQAIVAKIKTLLNVNVELPKIYYFGEESQQTEFKTSIVFPPNNSMRPDIKQQTFNIMKVICGMVNAYGGTIYFGVLDTGTAVGLDADLGFFEGSTDKFKNYVRNSIRTALGDQVNASVKEDYPEAGKHYVYAITVAASRQPVALRLDNQYYLREGTSTYAIEKEQLQSIMDDRDFSAYHNDIIDIDENAEPEPIISEPAAKAEKAEMPKPVRNNADGISIATSRTRSNVTSNWLDDYYVDKSCFIRIQSVGEWRLYDDIEWEEGILTLAIHTYETDGYLIVAYSDGKINKVPMSQIIDKKPGTPQKMYGEKAPMFVSPAKKDAALLTGYEDEKGKRCFRLDKIADMPDGKMLSEGSTLVDVEIKQMFFCDVIDHKYYADLKRLQNFKRSSIGMQLLSNYGTEEQKVLKSIGIEL